MSVQGLSLGMIETWGFPALVAATDAAAKAADVNCATYQGADSGIVTIYLVGDVSSVQAAVEIGEAEARRVGHLRHAHVIARPDQSVLQMVLELIDKQKMKSQQEKKQQEGNIQEESQKEVKAKSNKRGERGDNQ